MAKTWKAGVIACGSVIQVAHMPGYMRTPGVKLVAACDPVAERRAEAERICPGLRTYKDHREMLAAEQLDMVSVAPPNRFHAECAIAALEHGAHVLLEKPPALSMKEMAAIKAAKRKSGRQVIIGFSHRFMRGNQRIHKMLADGVIGEPFMIRLRLAHNGPYPGWAKDDWFYDPKDAGAGALLDMGIHAIDQAVWHLGPVKRVQAVVRTLRKKIEVDDNAIILMEFARSKALGYIEVGWTSPTGFNGMEIMGDAGCITEDYANGLRVTTGKITPNMKKKPRLKTRVVDPTPSHGGWSIEIREVAKAFRRGEELGMGIEAGEAALAVGLAALESSRTGKAVEVKNVK